MKTCNLPDEAGCSLALGFQNMSGNTRLAGSMGNKTLNLSQNNLSDETAKAFAETFIMKNISLKDLDLSVNHINDAGGELIA